MLTVIVIPCNFWENFKNQKEEIYWTEYTTQIQLIYCTDMYNSVGSDNNGFVHNLGCFPYYIRQHGDDSHLATNNLTQHTDHAVCYSAQLKRPLENQDLKS